MTESGLVAQQLPRNSPPQRTTAKEPQYATQAELLELVAGIDATGKRSLVGLTGPPGSGKSTLAAELAESLCSLPPVVPMDGFHLAQEVIEVKGLADRRGSPETFDSWGFVHLLTQIAGTADDSVVYAPRFDRSIEAPVAGAIPVRPADELVIVEGNYLLLDESPWAQIRPALYLCAYLELEDETRIRRLIERHVRHGKPRPEAERFVRDSDEKNAQLVKSGRSRADFIVRPGCDEAMRLSRHHLHVGVPDTGDCR